MPKPKRAQRQREPRGREGVKSSSSIQCGCLKLWIMALHQERMRELFHDEIDRLNRLHEGDGWRPCPRLSVFTFLQASLQSVLFFSGLTKHGMDFARQYELVQSMCCNQGITFGGF